MSTVDLPEEKLWRLWRALDENSNGFICAGEWGRFMRSNAMLGIDLNAEQSERTREAQEHDRRKRTVEWAEQTARTRQALRPLCHPLHSALPHLATPAHALPIASPSPPP